MINASQIKEHMEVKEPLSSMAVVLRHESRRRFSWNSRAWAARAALEQA